LTLKELFKDTTEEFRKEELGFSDAMNDYLAKIATLKQIPLGTNPKFVYDASDLDTSFDD
jgi:hypothetical protein